MSITDHLLRGLAPIPTTAWQAIDDETRERLTPLLAARRLADWVGPGGWRHDAMAIGLTTELDSLPTGLSGSAVHIPATTSTALGRIPRAVHGEPARDRRHPTGRIRPRAR